MSDDGWNSAELGAIAHIEMGQAPPSEYVTNRKVEDARPFLQGNAEFTNEVPNARLWCRRFPKSAAAGDALISVRAPVGELNWADQDYAIGRGLAAVRFRSVLPRYGYHQLALRKADLHRVAQGSTFDAVGSRELKTLSFPVPTAGEQRRIAEILDALDDQIRSSELVLSKLKAVRCALVEDLMARGISDDGRARDCRRQATEFRKTALGFRPRGWIIAPLREFLERTDYGISTSLSDAGRVPVLRMNNFANGEAKLDSLKYSNGADAVRLTLVYGDVLFNRTNSMEHVGRTGIWRGQLDVVSFASYLVRIVPNGRVTNGYLNHLLNLRQTQIDLRRWATPGVHQVNVNPTNLRRVVVAVPDSLSEQDRICDTLAQHDGLIDRERSVLSKLRSQKSGLLGDLLTGRVRVLDEVMS